MILWGPARSSLYTSINNITLQVNYVFWSLLWSICRNTLTHTHTLSIPFWLPLARPVSIGPSPLDRLLIHASCQTGPALPVLWRASAWVEAALLQTLVPWITGCTQGASVYSGAACLDDNVHGHKGDILKGGSDKTGAKEPKLWVFPERITKKVVCVCVCARVS